MTKHILYLASGSSRRFGSNKLLYPVAGRPLFLHGLETLQAAVQGRGDCTLTVVSRYAEIRDAAASLGIHAVDSPDSEMGVSHTIRAGISSLPDLTPEDFLLFAVADQPHLTAASVQNLLAQARPGTIGASLAYGDCPGNPTLFSARLVPELIALQGDTGGRKVLKRHPCIFVQAQSPRELEDIDTP